MRADYLLAWRVATNISKYCSYFCYEFGFLFRALFSQLEKIFNSIEIPPHLPNIWDQMYATTTNDVNTYLLEEHVVIGRIH